MIFGGEKCLQGEKTLPCNICQNIFPATETTLRHANSTSEEGVDGDDDDDDDGDDDDDEMFQRDDIDLFDEKVRRVMELKFSFYMIVNCYILTSSTLPILTHFASSFRQCRQTLLRLRRWS